MKNGTQFCRNSNTFITMYPLNSNVNFISNVGLLALHRGSPLTGPAATPTIFLLIRIIHRACGRGREFGFISILDVRASAEMRISKQQSGKTRRSRSKSDITRCDIPEQSEICIFLTLIDGGKRLMETHRVSSSLESARAGSMQIRTSAVFNFRRRTTRFLLRGALRGFN